MHIYIFFWGALESDMRGCCEECWALQLLPGKADCMNIIGFVVSSTHFQSLLFREVKVRRPVKDPYAIV